jgi:hypothetical protein
MMIPYQCSNHLTSSRRTGVDRRSYSYACCIPERRNGKDRRQQSRMDSMLVVVDEIAETAPNQCASLMD